MSLQCFLLPTKVIKNWRFANLLFCNYFVPLQKIKVYYEYHNIKT
ncbi:hypothetical protein HMPREF9073_00201 [Capnocytophaga sp. oral taxon 326 str. F0382]|nr:hypothetical protein HMPREF9073_00201 [Capnocytophaga sp. oral taxon 326 str. F0382]